MVAIGKGDERHLGRGAEPEGEAARIEDESERVEGSAGEAEAGTRHDHDEIVGREVKARAGECVRVTHDEGLLLVSLLESVVVSEEPIEGRLSVAGDLFVEMRCEGVGYRREFNDRRVAVDPAKAVDLPNRRPGSELERRALFVVCGPPQDRKDLSREDVIAAEGFAQASEPSRLGVDPGSLDEGTSALLAPHHAALSELRHRASDRDQAHTGQSSDFGLGGEPVSGPELIVDDVAFDQLTGVLVAFHGARLDPAALIPPSTNSLWDQARRRGCPSGWS